MVNKKLILVIALMLVVVGVISFGARPTAGVKVPPGPIVVAPNALANAHPDKAIPDAPTLPVAAAPVVIQDDFSAGLDKWETVQTAAANWGVRDGRLQQWGDASGEPVDEPSVLAVKDVTLGDGKVEASIFPTGGSPVGIAFRGSDAGYYRLDLYPNLPNKQAKAVLTKVTSKGAERISETAVTAWPGYKFSTWQIVTVSLAGGSISATVDGVQVLSTTDSSFSSGWAGVWTYANTGAQFDNVRIQPATSR